MTRNGGEIKLDLAADTCVLMIFRDRTFSKQTKRARALTQTSDLTSLRISRKTVKIKHVYVLNAS